MLGVLEVWGVGFRVRGLGVSGLGSWSLGVSGLGSWEFGSVEVSGSGL